MNCRTTIKAADLFCGGGGTSSGLSKACELLGLDLQLLALNHWQVAIDTHSANHPKAKHLCESIDNVDPRKAVPGGRLQILVASPECTHHSNARGGKPMSEQSRASAWHILRWAEALYIENIIIEDVREFRTWGPIGANNRPIKRLRGELYLQFLASLRALGYNVEERILNAADFGDPTTRERLFIMARRGKQIVWPEPSRGPSTRVEGFLSAKLKPWRNAREIIDWNLPGKSIFTRKRPLAAKTLERIIAGLKRFGGENAEPFLVVLRNHMGAQSIDHPVPALCAGGTHLGVCEPFLMGQQSCSAPRSLNDPVPTIATAGAISLVEPFLMAVNHGEDPSPRGGNARRTRSIDEPFPTVTCTRSMGLVEPFLLNIDQQSGGSAVRAIEKPVPTQTTKARTCLVEPFLAKFNGTAKANSVDDPLDTVTTKDRFALVTTDAGQFYVDIRFRMLQPRELARAQGFADSYEFKGNREEIVKQIGNAVPVNLAAALCGAVLADRAAIKKTATERLRVIA